MRYDLAVTSKHIYTGTRQMSGCLLIRGGKVVDIIDDEGVIEAGRTIAADDLYVLPGLIDTHCHLRDPGYTHKEDISSATYMAALGGVTCLYDMPNTAPAINSETRLREHIKDFKSKSYIDFGHNVSPVRADEVQGLARAGASAYKIWTAYDIERNYPHTNELAVTDTRSMYEVFERVAATGLPLYVHPTDHLLYQMFCERCREEFGVDFRSYAKALRYGKGVAIDLSVATLLEVQRSVGTRLHLLHASSKRSLEMIAEAKANGQSVTCETNPFALFLANDWGNIEAVGPYALGQWVPESDSVAMWDALASGLIDIVGTDHAPHTKQEKEPGWQDMYAAPGGAGPYLGHYLGLLLESVSGGSLTLQRLVESCCVAPAQLAGVAGRKGTLEPGADADIVVVDPVATKTLSETTLAYKCGWLANEGTVVGSWPILTIVRGNIVADHGEVLVKPGFGEFVSPVI